MITKGSVRFVNHIDNLVSDTHAVHSLNIDTHVAEAGPDEFVAKDYIPWRRLSHSTIS